MSELPKVPQSPEVREITRRVLELDEDVRFYRNEWESACERDRYGQERIKELEAELAQFHDDGLTVYGNKIRLLSGRIKELEAENALLKEKGLKFPQAQQT